MGTSHRTANFAKPRLVIEAEYHLCFPVQVTVQACDFLYFSKLPLIQSAYDQYNHVFIHIHQALKKQEHIVLQSISSIQGVSKV